MMDALRDTGTLLDALEIEMRRRRYRSGKPHRRIIGWRGPGVLFATRITPARSLPGLSPHPITIVTPHAHAAGWILDRLDDAFSPLLGTQLRFDFFERLAEAAEAYTTIIAAVHDTDENLLKILLREARDILEEMTEGEFPYVIQEGETP
jgi:hypothetical protein